VTSFIYDATSWPGWLLLQGDNTSATAKPQALCLNSYTPATDETWVFHMQVAGQAGTAGERRFWLGFDNTGDSNESITSGWLVTNLLFRHDLSVVNNGAQTQQLGPAVSTASDPAADEVFVLIKKSNVYYAFNASPYGGGPYMNNGGALTNVTKTGVTTFDRVCFYYSTDNATPTAISGIDFVRYYDSVTWAIMNP
jgi:hypothetical protein